MAETGEAAASPAFGSSWRLVCWKYGLGWLVSCSAAARALRVGRWKNRCRITDSDYYTCGADSNGRRKPKNRTGFPFCGVGTHPADGGYYLVPGMPQQENKLRYQHTTPTTADDSSPHRARDNVKPSRLYAPLLRKCSLPSVRVVHAVWAEVSLET